MRKRGTRDDGSSLELLLDTMCNTFGGVMFIAISLFVLIMASQTGQQTEGPPPPAPELQQEEIDRLEAILQEAGRKLERQKAELAIRQESLEQKQIQELALLEQSIAEKNAAAALTESACRTLRQQLRQLERQESELLARRQACERSEAELRHKILTQETELLKLARETPAPRHLSFHTLQTDARAPFLIFIRGELFWPIGPWQNQHGDRPDEAVTCEEFVSGGLRAVRCRPKPDRGLKVFSGPGLSPALRELLGKIPPERVPDLIVPPEAAETGFRLRELLKQERIKHGCILLDENSPDFTYFYSEHASYEY